MKKERKDDSFLKQAYYKGGDTALKEFISQNLKYPESSKKNKIEGDVHIRMDISHKGLVIDTKIIVGLDDACNEEAIRVVKLLQYIVPKSPRRLKVTYHKSIRIHFRLSQPHQSQNPENQHISSPSQQIQYTIISQKPSQDIQPASPVTYQYSIKIH